MASEHKKLYALTVFNYCLLAISAVSQGNSMHHMMKLLIKKDQLNINVFFRRKCKPSDNCNQNFSTYRYPSLN